MKNAGLSVALGLCGIGLVSSLQFSSAVGAENASGNSQDETGACVTDDEQLYWFDDQPQELCIDPDYGYVENSPFCASECLDLLRFPNQTGFRKETKFVDINLDGLSEKLCIPSIYPNNCDLGCLQISNGTYLYWSSDSSSFMRWENSLGCVPMSEAPKLSITSVQMIEETWSLVEREVAFDYLNIVPDLNRDWLILTTLLDVDGNGRLDLLCIILDLAGDLCYDPPTASAVWFRNITGPKPLDADINGDGVVNGIDLAYVLNSWTS